MNGLIVTVFFIAMLLVGAYSARKIKGPDSFFVADRAGSGFLITGSLLATILGGSSTIGLADQEPPGPHETLLDGPEGSGICRLHPARNP